MWCGPNERRAKLVIVGRRVGNDLITQTAGRTD
jgi:hypothetical protein